MRRKGLPWPGGGVTVVVILLLAGGWLAGRRLLPSSAPASSAPETEERRETFREWLWGTRSLDLAVQVGIIFVGALGIAALLPRGDEGPRDDEAGGGEADGGESLDSPSAVDGLEGAVESKPHDQF